MALIGWIVLCCVVSVATLLSGRIVSLAAVLLAKRKGAVLCVDPFSLLRFTGFGLSLDKGPLSRLAFKDLRLFRDVTWGKTFESWFRDGLFPVYLGGPSVTLQALENTQKNTKAQDAGKKTKKSAREKRGMNPWVAGAIARCLLGILPRIPLMIYDIQIRLEDLGVIVTVPGLALLFKSDKNELKAALKIPEVKVTFISGDKEGTSDTSLEELTPVVVSEVALTVAVAVKQGSFPRIDSVHLELNDIAVVLSEALFQLGIKVVESSAKSTRLPTPVLDKKRKTSTKLTPDKLMELIPGEVGVTISKIGVETRGIVMPVPMHAGVALEKLTITSQKHSSREELQVKVSVGPVGVSAGGSEGMSAIDIGLPKICADLVAKLKEKEESLKCVALDSAGVLDVQGISVTMQNDEVWKVAKSGLELGELWKERFLEASKQPQETEAVTEVEDGKPLEEDDPGVAVKREDHPEKKLFSRDPLLAETDALFSKLAECSGAGGEVGLVASEITDGKNGGKEPKGSEHDGDPSNDLDSGQDRKEEGRDAWRVDVAWDVQVKLSRAVVVDVMGGGARPLVSVSLEAIWAEAKMNPQRECGENYQKVDLNLGLRVLKVAIDDGCSISTATKACFELVRLGEVSIESSVTLPHGIRTSIVDVEAEGDVLLKDLNVEISSKAVYAGFDICEKTLENLGPLAGALPKRKKSKAPASPNKLQRQYSMKPSGWKARLVGLSVRYETSVSPLTEHSNVATDVSSAMLVSLDSMEGEPWQHWGGGQVAVKNLVVHFHPSAESTDKPVNLLVLESLQMKMEDRGGALGMQIIGDHGRAMAEIDMALFALQVGIDIGDFKKQFLALGKKDRSLSSIGDETVPSVLPDVPKKPQSTGRPFAVTVCVHDLTVTASIGELDRVSVVILEANTDTRNLHPRVYAKQVGVFMNDAELVECKAVDLTVRPSYTLMELEEKSKSHSRLKRSIVLRGRGEKGVPPNIVVDMEGLDLSQPSPLSTKLSNMAPDATPTPSSAPGSVAELESRTSTEGEDVMQSSKGLSSGPAAVKSRRRHALQEMGLLRWAQGPHADGTPELNILAVDIEMGTVCVTLPHDQHFGRMIMFLELWVEAVKEVVVGFVSRMKTALGKAPPRGNEPTKKKSSPPDIVEVAIKSQNMSFKLEAHPMEAWLALHGRLLRSFVVQQRAWKAGVDTIVMDVSKDDVSEYAAKEATCWIMYELFRKYRQRCTYIKAQCEEDLHNRGAWMSVASGALDALIMIGEKSHPKVFEASVKNIRELDKPTSDNVEFSRVQPVYVDAKLSNVVAHFGGEHAANISDIGFQGLIVRGRQMTHHPQTQAEIFKVGRWHSVARELPIKGARPTMKAYTKIEATLNGMRAQASIGLEPIWAQLANAFNRLTPPSGVNSDGTLRETGLTLHPWDKMRNTWRGCMRVRIRQMQAAMGATVNPVVTIQSERVELTADELDIEVLAGAVNLHAVGMRITMFMSGLRSAPEDALLELPLGYLPDANINFRFDWLMPQNRSPLDHYAYPMVTEPDPGIRLAPVDLTKDFVGEGYTMRINAELDTEGEANRVAEVPEVTLGEPQIRFLVAFVKLMEDAPIHVRGCWKRGTYFFKKKKKNSVGPEMPNLLHRLEIAVTSRAMEIRHHTLEPDDPSSDMLICCESVRVAGTWAFVKNIERAVQARKGIDVTEVRWKEFDDGVWRRVRGARQPPDMEKLEVEAFQIQGFLPDKHATNPLLHRTQPEAQHSSFLLHLLHRKSSRSVNQAPDLTTPPPSGVDGHIMSASCFWLRQLGGNPSGRTDVSVTLPGGQKKRPLKIMIEDVKVLMPVEVRNAVLGVYMHMFAAFTGPPKPASAEMADAARKTESDMRQEKKPKEDTEKQKEKEDPAQAKVTRDSSLLRKLLAQQESSSSAAVEEPEIPLSSQSVDQPPPDSKMILELEFVHVQLGLVSDISEGAVLLTLDSGMLHEHLSQTHHVRMMSLNVDHVQCYAMDTSIDPLNPVRWLEVLDGRLQIPQDSSGILTRIVKPFKVQLSDAQLLVMGQVLNPGRAAEELKLQSPMIEAVTESAQYDMLVDVVHSVATPPLPKIKLLFDTILGATGSAIEDTNEDILQAKDMLRAVYVEFNARRQEAYAVWCASGGGFAENSGSMLFDDGAPNRMRDATSKESDTIQSEMVQFIQSFSGSVKQQQSSALGKNAMALLLLLLDDQISIARTSCVKSAQHLAVTRNEIEEANKHKKLFKSMTMSFGVDQVSWRLKKDGADFMQAHIQGVTYYSSQNKDLSGESKVSVHRIQLLDAARVGEPEQGVVLSVLNPESSEEEMLRGLAVRGCQTSSHVYYEHIEVWVHPLFLQFSEKNARDLAAYFFGGDEGDLQKEQQDFVRGVETRTNLRRMGSNNRSYSDSDGEMDDDTRVDPSVSKIETGGGHHHTRTSTSDAGASMFGMSRMSSLSKSITETEGDPLEPLMEPEAKGKRRRRKKKGLAKRRKVHFVHVRFNKVSTQITYKGRPFHISNLQIILRMNEYNNVQGHFRDILNKYKKNVITSILKSAAQFLGRRYEPDEEWEKERRRKGVRERIRELGRRKKTASHGGQEEECPADAMVISEESRIEQKGKKMLLGEP
ncbi:hypothetical protein BSKO_01317 [Bryopsis sp. KO-2023]|nr:hypothetical protein BSKO_01317 [Bryopsis sp. KO-2023]